ncbi:MULTISPECIES: hypothetical protein [unclassified Streptomyces]|nr:hypothetical protein [Streptomyces sp. CB01883]
MRRIFSTAVLTVAGEHLVDRARRRRARRDLRDFAVRPTVRVPICRV